jgi:phage terminase Nu1 subunit (DNA packaging protein)
MKNRVTRGELATAFECTTRWIDKLVKKGMPREAQGNFDLGKCAEWYSRFLQAALEQRQGPEQTSGSLAEDRICLAKTQAEQIEFEAKALCSEFVPAAALSQRERTMFEEVQRRFGDEFVERITSLVMGLSRDQIADVLDREIRTALCELGKGPALPPPDLEWKN